MGIMYNPVAFVSQEIEKSVLGKLQADISDSNKLQNLIRFHNNKLQETGDVSFTTNSIAWGKLCAFSDPPKIDEDQEFLNRFLVKSKNWVFPVERCSLHGSRYFLYFQRDTVISKILQQVLTNKDLTNGERIYGYMPKNPVRRIFHLIKKNDDSNLTFYRASLISKVLEKVLELSEWTVVNDAGLENVVQVNVVSVAAANSRKEEKKDSNDVTVLCGIVTDLKTGKLTNLTTAEYIKLRTNDLNLMALHKYGIRAKDDKSFTELMNRLGVAAVTVDLLEKKCSSPATIIRNGQGSNTKGACFILYNSARLETLLKAFECRVKDGVYGPLPPVEDIDFSLLNNEEEWQLVYVYVFGFPDLIERCLRQLECGNFAPHLIIQFLSGFVGIFSVYYRHIRILTERRPQLMPQLYARIYLLKALREIFNCALSLLDIKPVSHM